MERDEIKRFTGRIFRDMAGAMAAGLAYVGTRTGLFRAMADKPPMRLDEVVRTTGLQSRYVEEWLNAMVCAGYIAHDAVDRTYFLPPEHAYLLASDGSDHFAGGLFHMVPMLLGVAPKVAAAFERGGGVDFEEYGEEGILALDLINRGNYANRLTDYWLPAMPDVIRTLHSGSQVLDLGCGAGQVSLTVARAFPHTRVLGIDVDARSIEKAKSAVPGSGAADRIEFCAGALEDMDRARRFDLIMACDCVHDLAEPLTTLRAVRERLAPGGVFFVIEPKAADALEDNCNDIGTMFYGFSVFHCMTQSLARGGAGLGACMGPARTEALMRSAGFGRFEVLDIKSQVNLFYAVRA